MLNLDGYVTEATTSNIFVVFGERLVTPPLDAGILEGVTRGVVIELAKGMGIPVEERNITREELYTADEVFLCGTIKEIMPVSRVDEVEYSIVPGRITRRIMEEFRRYVRKN